jgi:hypothetical protein
MESVLPAGASQPHQGACVLVLAGKTGTEFYLLFVVIDKYSTF